MFSLFIQKRLSTVAHGFGTLLLLCLVFRASLVVAAPISLDEAWQLAEQNNPDLKRLLANRNAIEGELADANAPLYNNPTINFEGRRRSIYQAGKSDPQRGEWGAGIAQTFELAGQQGLRRQTAETRRAALAQEISEAFRRIRAQVEEQFVTVLAIQKRIETEQRILDLINRNTDLSRKRVAAGEDSKLDGNLAIVDAERARNQLSLLQEQLTRARTELAALLQLPQQELPEVVGVIAPPEHRYTLDELMAALEARPAVQALSLRENSARSRLDLERSLRYPDLTVNLNNTREAGVVGDDTISSLGFSLPLPLFRRNATGIGRATTDLTQVEVERAAFLRDTKTTIQAAWQRKRNMEERVNRLSTEVFPRLEENLRLSQLAFQNGEIGLPQLLIVQRQTIDAQRDLLEVQRDLRLTQIELEYAAGWPVANPSASQN